MERQLNIAIADDNPMVLRTLELLIQAMGHTVTCTACDGDELIRKCVEVKVDLAFVDLHMPVMDGLEAAEILSTHSIPVVLVSGHPDAREIVLENEPLVTMIRKPALLDEIQAAIDLAMRS